MIGCAYCGANGDTKLVRDHVVPRSRGGPDNAFNIVMACEPCNKDKRDATAIEWLGERCPEIVKDIEDRVNRKLAKDFQKRDRKPVAHKASNTLFAFTIGDHGYLEYMGEVVSESEDRIRLEVTDAILFLMTGGRLWQLSGELKDIPRSSSRLFNDRECCVHAASRFMRPMEKAKA
jgi:hypothetical protein